MNLEDEIAIFERVPTFAALGRQALHARTLGFVHPATKEAIPKVARKGSVPTPAPSAE